MRYITRKTRLKLMRGAALVLIGGLAAGCSSDVSRFRASDFADTNGAAAGSNATYASSSRSTPVDATYTGSVNRQAVRPAATVGGGGLAQQQALPAPSGPGQYPATASSQPIRQQALPAPSSGQQKTASLSQPARTGTTAAAPRAEPAQPTEQRTTSTTPEQPRDPAPQPGEDQRLAVLPGTPKPRSQSGEGQNSSAAPNPGNTGSGGSYTVVSGDTLYGIASKTGASVASIKAANGLSDGYLQIGQKLVIPAAGTAPQTQVASASRPADAATASAAPKESEQPAQKASTTQQKTVPEQSEQTQLAAVASDSSDAAPDSTGIGKLRWPVRGRVISEYGSAQGTARNDGIDISVPAGTPVKSAENGVVIYAGDGLKEFGNTVLVRHDDGLVTVYGHATALRVKRGDQVKRGQEIALSGMSGNAKQPMLHFEVRKDATPVNPTSYLE